MASPKLKISPMIEKTVHKLTESMKAQDVLKFFIEPKYTQLNFWCFFPPCIIIPSIYKQNQRYEKEGPVKYVLRTGVPFLITLGVQQTKNCKCRLIFQLYSESETYNEEEYEFFGRTERWLKARERIEKCSANCQKPPTKILIKLKNPEEITKKTRKLTLQMEKKILGNRHQFHKFKTQYQEEIELLSQCKGKQKGYKELPSTSLIIPTVYKKQKPNVAADVETLISKSGSVTHKGKNLSARKSKNNGKKAKGAKKTKSCLNLPANSIDINNFKKECNRLEIEELNDSIEIIEDKPSIMNNEINKDQKASKNFPNFKLDLMTGPINRDTDSNYWYFAEFGHITNTIDETFFLDKSGDNLNKSKPLDWIHICEGIFVWQKIYKVHSFIFESLKTEEDFYKKSNQLPEADYLMIKVLSFLKKVCSTKLENLYINKNVFIQKFPFLSFLALVR